MGNRTVTAVVGLGSNVGRRLDFLRRATRSLRGTSGVRVRRCSPVYETSPVGPRQRKFLNAVVVLRTSLSPDSLLKTLKRIERELGRRRRRRWGPREIDLDLLFFGALRKRTKSLTVPHPRWMARKFVLRPLSDVAPRFRDPVSGRPIKAFFRELTDPSQRIRLYRVPV
ncbi:MAG TPA: 2-amino-4-hydroxy-6-hydroxymethyldihydropteridine diphosphokinase [Elusimicrobiota bacterium]|nr:2-amino-4-hydroxy-6-hydroxymethyldihydropteridine diphosphokinase [Elusimicrobiota bacterium]